VVGVLALELGVVEVTSVVEVEVEEEVVGTRVNVGDDQTELGVIVTIVLLLDLVQSEQDFVYVVVSSTVSVVPCATME
jgi:hypothetical protein